MNVQIIVLLEYNEVLLMDIFVSNVPKIPIVVQMEVTFKKVQPIS